jgi:endoglucanase
LTSVRFYMNYGIFEDDTSPCSYKEDGFTWLDINIAAAKTYGIRLILNMHYPQGGFQSNGNGDALWNDRSNQLRLIALWKKIAGRYKDEDTVIGYGLVNEPVPLEGVSR